MTLQVISNVWGELIQELKVLEAFFPRFETTRARAELAEQVTELEELIAAAGIPDDEQSRRALLFLNKELAEKRLNLNGFE